MLTATARRWVFPALPDPTRVDRIAHELRLPPPLCRLLVHRGYGEPAAVRDFLRPHLGQIHPPLRMAGMADAVDAAALSGVDVGGRAVLVHTGWDVHWGTQRYLSDNPFLTADAAEHLRREGAVLVGIDSLNIDNLDDTARPVHSILLAAGIPIAEHLTGLGGVPDRGFRFSAVPAKVAGVGTWPVRAYARLEP
jgi:hypothetical protein